MRQIIIPMLAAGTLILSSCGAGVTTDKAELSSMSENYASDYEGYCETQFDANKDMLTTQKEILKKHGDKMGDLLEKVGKKDESALDDYVAYVEAEREYSNTMKDASLELYDLRNAISDSREIIMATLSNDAKTQFRKDNKLDDDKWQAHESKFHADWNKWHDNEFCKSGCGMPNHGNPFNDYSK